MLPEFLRPLCGYHRHDAITGLCADLGYDYRIRLLADLIRQASVCESVLIKISCVKMVHAKLVGSANHGPCLSFILQLRQLHGAVSYTGYRFPAHHIGSARSVVL